MTEAATTCGGIFLPNSRVAGAGVRRAAAAAVRRIRVSRRVAMLILAAGALSGCGGPRTPRFPEVGSAAPDFALEPLNTDSRARAAVRLSEHRGTPVVIVFWAQWCPPCRDEYAEMRELAQRAEAEGIRLYAVLFEERPQVAQAWQRVHGAEVPMLMDPSAAAARAYLVNGVPRSFAIGADGRVRLAHHAYRPGDVRRLVEAAKSVAE